MKKIIFIIGLLLSVNSFGQTYQAYVRAIFPINVTDPSFGHLGNPSIDNNIDSVYACDSVWFYVEYTESNIPNTSFSFPIYITDTIGNTISVGSVPYLTFKKGLLPNTGGTGYKVKAKMPCNLKPASKGKYYQLKFANSYLKNSFAPFFIKPGAAAITTSIINPLEEKTIKIKYYNTYGIEIEKPSNGLYIWKAENGESGKIYITG